MNNKNNNNEEEVGGNAIISTQHNNDTDDAMCRCASCGATEVDAIKLKTCTGCKSARYCSIKCQKEHRSQHKRACKKRAAELRDELLFKQPETTALGDCPICLVPLPLDLEKYKMQSCCSKINCIGCAHAHSSQRREECPFCRYPVQPEEDDEIIRNNTRRAEANDPIALQWMGSLRNAVGDYSSEFQYWTKAAGLGEIMSHFYLGLMYHLGNGVEKDEKKETYHMEEAAIGGHPEARFILGSDEWHYGSKERGTKHMLLLPNLDMTVQ